MNKTKNINRRLLVGGVLLALVLAAVLLGMLAAHRPRVRNPDPSTNTDTNAVTEKISQPTKKTSNPDASGSSQGGAVDNHGSKVASTPSSAWTSSSSRNITLHSPAANSAIKAGDIISGTSDLTTVQYRLVSDKTGVVAQGQLSVTNGKFSGTMQFTSPNSTGHLDIFSYNPSTGAENNSIRVTVNLSR